MKYFNYQIDAIKELFEKIDDTLDYYEVRKKKNKTSDTNGFWFDGSINTRRNRKR